MEMRFLVSAIRRCRWLVVVMAILGLGIGVALAHHKAVAYEARASLTVTQPDLTAILGQGGGETPSQYVADQIGIIQSTAIATQVAAQIPGMTAASVAAAVTVSERGTSDIVDIVAKAASPATAAVLANTMANVYLNTQQGQLKNLLQQQANNLNAQVTKLNTELAALPSVPVGTTGQDQVGGLETELTQANASLNQVQLTLGLLPASASLFDKATPPQFPVPRKTTEYALLGIIGGIVLGAVGGIIYAAFRPRLFRPVEVEDSLGLPVVAELPWVEGAVAATDVDSDAAFAREALKACVFIVAATAKAWRKTVLVASAEPGAGVTTVARTLAGLLEQSANTVELVTVRDPIPLVEPNGAVHDESATEVRKVRALPKGRGDKRRADVPLNELVGSAGGVLGFAQRDASQWWPLDEETSEAIMVFDGGSLEGSASTMSLAQSVDVIVLVVPLPSANEREMNTLLRTVLAKSPARIVVVAKHR